MCCVAVCVAVSSLLVAYVSRYACLVLQTSNSLCFSLYLLSRHPDVQERLAAEVRATVADRNATYDDCERMPYMRAVLKESLRMFPVVTMHVRRLQDDLSVRGVRVPKDVSTLPTAISDATAPLVTHAGLGPSSSQ